MKLKAMALLVGMAFGCSPGAVTHETTTADGDGAAATTGGDATGGDTTGGATTGGDTTGGETTGGGATTDGGTTGGPPPGRGVGGDNLVFRGSFDGAAFVEIVDVEHHDPFVLTCNGTKGLAIYKEIPGAGTSFVVHKGGLGDGSSGPYPRCQHMEVVLSSGDINTGVVSVFVTNRGDETQPTPWIKWIRFDNGLGGLSASFGTTALPVVQTLFGDPATRSFEGLAYKDGFLYAATHGSGVLVIDTSSGQLVPAATVAVGGNAYDVAVADSGHLVVASLDTGLSVFDITSPRAPDPLGVAAVPGSPTRLAVDGTTAYVAAGNGGLQIVDVSNPDAPKVVGSHTTPSTAMDINFSDGRVVVANWTDVRVFDVSDPAAPWLLAAEEVPSANGFSRVLAADMTGTEVFVGEWTALLSYDLKPEMTPPDIRLIHDELVFDEDDNALGLLVANEGLLPLTLEIAVTGSGYAASPSSATVQPGKKELIEVVRTALDAGFAQVQITTNDPDEGQVTVPLSPRTNGPGLGPGDMLPNIPVIDAFTGQPTDVATVLNGKVGLLAYFATF